MRHTNTWASRWNLSGPLHTGQASSSSRCASIRSVLRAGAKFAEYARQQFVPLALTEVRRDRHIPQPRSGEATAFYGIFLGHEHRQIITERHVARSEAVVIGEGVLDQLEPLRAQRREEAPRVADAGHSVQGLAAKLRQLARALLAIEAQRRLRQQLHRE